jgi:hypothetical protein
MSYPPGRVRSIMCTKTNYMKLAAASGNHLALMLMMLNSGCLMETSVAAYRISNYCMLGNLNLLEIDSFSASTQFVTAFLISLIKLKELTMRLS